MAILVCAALLRRRKLRTCRRTISSAQSQKGTGELEGASYEEMTYEGYGPGGVAILVDVLTDNKNRAASEIRHAFTK